MRWWWLAVPAVVAAFAWALWPDEPTDEERITEILEEMRQAAEARQPGGILRHVDEAFRSDAGLGKRELQGMLIVQLMGAQRVGVTFVRKQIRVATDAATADVSLWLSRDGQRDMRQIVLRFIKTHADWKVSGAQHDPVPTVAY